MKRLVPFLVLALVGIPAALQAQAVNVGVTVTLPPVGGGGTRALSFGTSRLPGDNIDTGAGSEANAQSAKWAFTGLAKSRTINVSLSSTALTAGPYQMLASYNTAAYGSWCTRKDTDTCAGASATTGTFNPGNVSATGPGTIGTFSATTSANGAGNNDRVLEIWVGSKLSIPANQPSGTYTGSITATITVL